MGGVSRGKALLYALVALAVGVASFVIGVQTSLGQRAEQSVLGASSFGIDSSAILRLVSAPAVAIALVVIGVLAWCFHGFVRAVWIVGFGAVALFASQLLKHEWLVRPTLLDFDIDNTFPSGHMTVFAIVVAGLIWAVPAGARGVFGVAGAALMGAVSWQLLAFGWHRPSDVLGAQALGVFTFAIAAAIRPPHRARTIRVPGSGVNLLNKVLGVLLTLCGWALVLGGLILVAAAVSMHSDSLLLGGSEIALVGSSALSARAYMRLGA